MKAGQAKEPPAKGTQEKGDESSSPSQRSKLVYLKSPAQNCAAGAWGEPCKGTGPDARGSLGAKVQVDTSSVAHPNNENVRSSVWLRTS